MAMRPGHFSSTASGPDRDSTVSPLPPRAADEIIARMSGEPRLDLDFVRRQFPAFAEPSLENQAFFENAGGSYPCSAVVNRLHEYYRRLKVQPYYPYAASTEAGEWTDAA